MPIEFRCEHCGRLLRAGDGTEGRRTLCPGCGGFSTVPIVAETAPVTPSDAEQAFRPPSEQPGSPFGPGDAPVGEPFDPENPYQAPMEYGGPLPPASDSKATTSLVLGVVGLFSLLCCPLMGVPFGLIGLILGLQARNSRSGGLAIAGIVLCSIPLLLGLLWTLLVGVALVIG